MKKKIIAMSLALVVVAGVGKGIVAKAETYSKNGSSVGSWIDDNTTNTDDSVDHTDEDGDNDLNITDTDGVTSKKTVTITSAQADTVYSVDITWPDLTISESAAEWNPSNHTYENGGSSWGDTYSALNTTANIVVANHSNAAVQSKCVFKYSDGTDSATEDSKFTSIDYSNSELTVKADDVSKNFVSIDSAAGESYYGNSGSYDSNTHILTVSGTLNSTSVSSSVNVGTATITLKNTNS